MTLTISAEQLMADSTPEPLVLIVNSDDSVRTWVEATVISAGLRAHSLNSAAELLSCSTAEQAACVILDIVLPDASGLDIQEELAGWGVSILFLTRDPCISSCVRALKAGAVDFLITPCDSTQLVRALRDALHKALSSRSRCAQQRELLGKYGHLTAREREVFALVSSGLLNKQIAHRLQISEITVQIHRGRVMRKMSARTLASLVRMSDALRPISSNELVAANRTNA